MFREPFERFIVLDRATVAHHVAEPSACGAGLVCDEAFFVDCFFLTSFFGGLACLFIGQCFLRTLWWLRSLIIKLVSKESERSMKLDRMRSSEYHLRICQSIPNQNPADSRKLTISQLGFHAFSESSSCPRAIRKSLCACSGPATGKFVGSSKPTCTSNEA